jgi:hypothetical protein
MTAPKRATGKVASKRASAPLTSAEKDFQWIAREYGDLRKAYSGQYVIVWRQRVRAHGKALKSATAAAKKERVPLDEALVEFIPAVGQTLVL